jgi:S-adenosylmethionine:tRNA-ribosyltransferase-isomerase (queuine synthetase)
VIAVGTTVVRAFETRQDPLARSRRARVDRPRHNADDDAHRVDALLTGWHEPASTHLSTGRRAV